jgi:hypothetical protein
MQSPRERYNEILDKYEAIRESLHLVANEELDAAITLIERYEMIMKQLEDLYGEELL